MTDDCYTLSNNLAMTEVYAGFLFGRYMKECFTQICRALYGDTMLVPLGGTKHSGYKAKKHLSLSFAV